MNYVAATLHIEGVMSCVWHQHDIDICSYIWLFYLVKLLTVLMCQC